MSRVDTPSGFVSGLVSIVGRANVGKSTLMNLLVGRKVSIVSPVPQTTRTRIRGIRNLPGGQIVLVDSPGMHKPRHELNRRMVAEAGEAIRGVDLVLFMVDTEGAGQHALRLGPGDRYVLSMLPPEGPPVLLVINKIDRIRKQLLLPFVDSVRGLFPFREILMISALRSENTVDLPERILRYLPPGPPLYPEQEHTDQPERALAAEIIREKVLHRTREEIPHAACVLIDLYEETEAGALRIEASIIVEKDSQKKIVIGTGGAVIKEVGIAARRELEAMLDRKVILKLWVAVRAGWRDRESFLLRLGLPPAH